MGGKMEAKTEKKSIKNEVQKKMRKKYAPRAKSRLERVGPGGMLDAAGRTLGGV